jgi:hypothetical protein
MKKSTQALGVLQLKKKYKIAMAFKTLLSKNY